MKKIRINELARECEQPNSVIIAILPEFGVTEKKTHSSSIDEDVADAIRRHYGVFVEPRAPEIAAEAREPAPAGAAEPGVAEAETAAKPAPAPAEPSAAPHGPGPRDGADRPRVSSRSDHRGDDDRASGGPPAASAAGHPPRPTAGAGSRGASAGGRHVGARSYSARRAPCGCQAASDSPPRPDHLRSPATLSRDPGGSAAANGPAVASQPSGCVRGPRRQLRPPPW